MIRILISNIEATIGRDFNKCADFVWLSDFICDRAHERISPTTLRRLWGKSSEMVKPSRFTLDVLSRLLLFSDFDDFCRNVQNAARQSGVCMGEKIETADLSVGQLLRLNWMPDRSCLLKHLGNGQFQVVEVQNTRLSVGDTFTCKLFINNEPAYLDNLFHNGQGPLRYIAGLQSGVMVEAVGGNTF